MVKRVSDKDDVVETRESGTVNNLWLELKDKVLDIFALPGQTVETYFKPVPVEPTKLYLTYSVSSALPALETALGSAFKVELVNKYVVVSKL
jgi:hypothetical protein